MEERKYKAVTDKEIQTLVNNGCTAEDWKQVLFAEETDLSKIRNTVFKGTVKVGKNTEIIHANLSDVTIGDNCSISNVNGRLSGLDIQDDVIIDNTGTIACEGETTFGNGHSVTVLNESGGRELRITTETSAQTAYLYTLYRDKKDLISALNAMTDRLCSEVKRKRAVIGKGAQITNCNEIINVGIGPSSIINGASSLKNGTVVSSAEAPTCTGHNVIAENFIFQKGSHIESGALIESSLIGEAAQIGKQFSAENSVFFANCEGFHSEACSAFAGPYSVTHHKSTLLIASLFSFFNAGSGTNQSNHMYKLGPLHQGIFERGCKTGSFSYMLWPSRIGAFTVVMGKHYANFNTSDLPFSYIEEKDNKSTLIPGINLFTVGTMRDGEKWATRDKRKSGKKLDLIIFDVFSPYTAQKMIKARNVLTGLKDNSDKSIKYVTHNGIRIKRLLLKTCSRYYKIGLDKYLGDILINKILKEKPENIRELLNPAPESYASDEWIDVCGLLCRKSRIDRLIADICSGIISTFAQMYEALEKIYNAYKDDEWQWFLSRYREMNGNELCDETAENLQQFVEQWKTASHKFFNMVRSDAEKEFDNSTRLSFGIDGSRDLDFEAVRGTFEDNAFVKKLEKEIIDIDRKYAEVIKLIK